jgi:lipopolysaccharide/colanic/teichoic acid biosynthesis glycosyltransferase
MKNYFDGVYGTPWKRSQLLLAADSTLTTAATLCALILRDNFELSQAHFTAFLPYFTASFVVSPLVFIALRVNRPMWRFSGLRDYLHVAGSIAAVAACASTVCFAYNRLDGVARSLPLLQFLMGTAFLVIARALHRRSHASKQEVRACGALLQVGEGQPEITVLIAGATSLAETYLQAAAELFPGAVRVAGLVGRSGHYESRALSEQTRLGRPEDIEQILDRLRTEGINIERIVVAAHFGSLSPEARAALLQARRSRGVALQLLTQDLGFAGAFSIDEGKSGEALRFNIAPSELDYLAGRRYWRVKRVLDGVLASLLLIVCLPIMLATALAVAASVGFPVLFMQLRPGLGGRPFWLYKLRTMRARHAKGGHLLNDSDRVPFVGRLLRRFRLDELPQLFNILRGDMSFVGPRPLLAKDQSQAFRTRLLVRPGLTGWAQVAGGRDIPAADKAALDIWYVRNASLALDLKIVLATVPVVLFGERIRVQSIDRAWLELAQVDALAMESK